jgi:8-oxo-dGTP diphosphatase
MKIDQNIKLAVDAVLFGYNREEGVSVLLIKRKIEPFIHQWALPGGFIKNGESLEEAVYRELEEETGVKINYLEQLYTFGDPHRDPRMRIVAVAYYGLVKPESFKLFASTDAEEAAWFNIKKLPRLAFDHRKIIQSAIERLRGKIIYEPVGFELLDARFPFSDLEQLYTILLDRDIDRRNFKRKIMKLGILEELDQKASLSSPGRPGNLYKFNKEKYFKLKKQGFSFELHT